MTPCGHGLSSQISRVQTRPGDSSFPICGITHGLDSRDGIFNDNRVSWINPQQPCRHQKRIRSRLPCQAMCTDGGAVDPHVEECVQLGGL